MVRAGSEVLGDATAPARTVAASPARRRPALLVPELVVAVTAGVAAIALVLARAVLYGDGVVYLTRMLVTDDPMAPHWRVGVAPLQWPAILVSRVSDSTMVLGAVMTAGYVAVTLAALVLCWAATRRRRTLFLFAALGLGFLAAPIALYQISEARLVATLAWPLLLLVVTGPSRWRFVAGVLVTVAMFATHPEAVVLCGAVGFVALLHVLARRTDRAWFVGWGVGLVAASLVRYTIVTDKYDSDASSMKAFRNLMDHTDGLVVQALVLALVALVLLVAHQVAARHPGRVATILGWGAVAAGAAGGVRCLQLAFHESAWATTFNARTLYPLLVAVAVVVVGFAALGLRGRSASPTRMTSALVAALLVVGCVATIVTARGWSQTQAATRQAMQPASGCVWPGQLIGAHASIANWTVGTLSLVVQGRHGHAVITGAPCPTVLQPAGVVLPYQLPIPYTGGWFDLTKLRR